MPKKILDPAILNPAAGMTQGIDVAPVGCSNLSNITESKQGEETLRAVSYRQQAILSAIPDIIMEVDNHKVYTWANQPGLEFFGAEVIGHEAAFYFEGEQDTYKVVNPLFEGAENIICVESWQRRKDGQKRLLAWWCHVLKDAKGNVTGTLSSARDITEQKQTEIALAEERNLLVTLMDNVPDTIYFKDAQSRIIRSNRAHARRVGLTDPDQMIGKTDFDLFGEEHARAAYEDEQEVMRSGQPVVDKEEKEIFPDGHTLWVSTTKMPLRDQQGRIVGTFGISRDITERKQVEQALRHSRNLLDLTGQMAKIGGWELDLETQTLSWTEEVYRIHEVDPATRLDVTEAINFYAPEARPVIAAAVQAGIDTGAPWDLELPLITAQGRRIWVRAQGAAERQDGKTVRLYGAFQEITERIQAEQLREAMYTISRSAIVAENLQDLYLSIHRALGYLIPAESFYIASYDSDADLISFPYFVDQYDEHIPPRKPGHGLTEYVLRTGQPLHADPQVFAQLVQQGEVELVGTNSVDWLGAPLKVGAKVLGVMALQSYTESVRFGHKEIELLEFISYQVATAIEHKLAQQRIGDALAFNNMLIDASTLGISAYDSSGKCILANGAIATIIGATHEQVLGQNYNQIESWKKSGLLESAREAVTNGHETRREIHTTSTFGKEIWLDCRFTPFVSNGEPHLLLTIDDISIPKQAEVALQTYAAKLERSNRDLQEFAYVASHDLQEPLRKVLAFGDRLANKYRDALDETGRDYLKRMQGASQRMQILINDLLSFSRVSTRAQPFSKVDLNTLAQEVVSDLENQIERTQGRVEIGELPTIEADLTQMRQLLQNLIINALKFHQDGIPPIIQVSAQLKDGECQIFVKDNGIGFDIQYLDRIFKPFQRLHNREEYEGSGMGLAICRRIIERHGGSITAASTPGEGSTFVVTLPIHPLSQGDSSHV